MFDKDVYTRDEVMRFLDSIISYYEIRVAMAEASVKEAWRRLDGSC